MASLLRDLLLKKPPPPRALRFLVSLDELPSLDPYLSPLPHQNPPQRLPLLPLLPDAAAGGASSPSLRHALQAYPAFPHCFLAAPIDVPSPDGPADLDGDGGGGGTTTVWADSVKKKRKRKMNKHKQRKLRKRLRYKSK
ncbi:hypothetical protein BHE74_00002269 [Ensete ventricosum]|nr:hypothetical protein GW17_00018590 [Ensete ventricosum]RWW88851.1 hypothetical protein BHE74_00002269 [Ensete ventricosum]